MVVLSDNTKKKFKDVFKQQLKHHRVKILRCTQEELASKLNISTQYYKNLEHGKAIPSTKMLITLSEQLDFRVDYLFLQLLDDVKGDNKTLEQFRLESINNTISDSERRALIYHWEMYMNPQNKSGFRIVEDPSFSPEKDSPAKRKSSKRQPD